MVGPDVVAVGPREWPETGSRNGWPEVRDQFERVKDPWETERFDVVHATAFPYAFPIACARRLARRLRVPFVLTPFLHLGDPEDRRDRTRRQYTQPALMALARSAAHPTAAGENRSHSCGIVT